jgi:5-hydroxyisourate hydrolase
MAAARHPSFSTHVLDNERGLPAAGVRVTLERRDDPADTFTLVGDAATDANGRIAELLPGALAAGVYRICFYAGDYFVALGGDAPFLRVVTIELEIVDTRRHYHVPLLMTRYACTSYRGS